MKIPIVIMATLAMLSVLSACRDKCKCRDLEDCVDGDCVLKPNSYYLGNTGIVGVDLYHGVVNGNSCVDTLVLDLNPAEPNPFYRYRLYANVPPFGTYNVAPELIQQISDTEFTLGSGAPICNQSIQIYRYASYIHCKKYTDSIQMFIGFRQSDDLPDADFIDTCRLTLYK